MAKRANLLRIKEFSRQLTTFNQQQFSKKTTSELSDEEVSGSKAIAKHREAQLKKKYQNSPLAKIKEFSKNVPKPKLIEQPVTSSEQGHSGRSLTPKVSPHITSVMGSSSPRALKLQTNTGSSLHKSQPQPQKGKPFPSSSVVFKTSIEKNLVNQNSTTKSNFDQANSINHRRHKTLDDLDSDNDDDFDTNSIEDNIHDIDAQYGGKMDLNTGTLGYDGFNVLSSAITSIYPNKQIRTGKS